MAAFAKSWLHPQIALSRPLSGNPDIELTSPNDRVQLDTIEGGRTPPQLGVSVPPTPWQAESEIDRF
jgi:hypothetical protein